ncbi:MAG: AAA family ATPase [Dehalococcoidia bacterium]
MKPKQYEVPVEKLRWKCDPGIFEFECTKELSPLGEFIGQERAAKAIEFGLNMSDDGYNIYVAGLTGTGKTTMVKTYIEKLIEEKETRGEMPVIEDWCYLYNFREPDQPQIVSLPQGKGKEFRDDMNQLLNRARKEMRRAFTSDEYKEQKEKVMEESQTLQKQVFESVSEEARQQDFALKVGPAGPTLIPTVNGHPMEEKQFNALSENAKKELNNKHDELIKKLQSGIEQVADLQKQTAERLQKLDKDIGEFTISRLINMLLITYQEQSKISKFLYELKRYTLDNIDLFKDGEEPAPTVLGMPVNQAATGKNPFLPFQVNVFVDNSEVKGPPVVIESNPNFGNLFGMIERRFLLGGYVSDHTMIKPGALSKANGGYLLLSAYDIAINSIAWFALKRAIKNREVRIEDPFEQFGLFAPQGMRPEPMPVKIKIILIGESFIYHLLSMHDEDFWEIFRVKADFDYEIDKTEKNMKDYAAFIAVCCEECGTKHFDPAGVARMIEYSSRMVSDQEKMSSRFAFIKQLIQESDYWASRDGDKLITDKHVAKAIEERIFRHNLADEKIRDMINRGEIMIDIAGEETGQVNGLSIYSLGDIAFGKPSRITASTFMGRGGVINIERESEMSGPIHNKGVMILSGYLGWRYAQDKPLSLSASLCFEQSYEGVDGDSASSAELYAILSSIAEVPIRQGIAVTGSVNQKGQIQPIGGVNLKIEGFFRVCQAQGLTGEQGVLIPGQNIRNLMLKEDVVQTVKDGKFHIYTAKTVDEGMEILTGLPSGVRKKDGTYPKGTINYLVDKKLKGMTEKLKKLTSEDKSEGKA